MTATFKAGSQAAWREWLDRHYRTAREIWLLLDGNAGDLTLTYLDAVEEDICFGWIDSTQKRLSPTERAQRFSPRSKQSKWTEVHHRG